MQMVFFLFILHGICTLVYCIMILVDTFNGSKQGGNERVTARIRGGVESATWKEAILFDPVSRR